MNTPPGSVPPPVWDYAREVAAAIAGAADGALVGAYLHGSGAMGGWHTELSDVDLLAVVSRSLHPEQKRESAKAIGELSAPGAGLEFSIVTRASLKDVRERPPFELHVTTGADAKVIDGKGHRGDSDLVMHYAVCRERGVAVLGPPPAEVFPVVPRAVLLAAFVEELAWGLEHAPVRYAVLNACRAWAFAEGAGLLSKVEGAEWALTRGALEMGQADAIRSALAAQAGGEETTKPTEATALVAAAVNALEQALLRAT
jgi:predicted nucleotidyltransferase